MEVFHCIQEFLGSVGVTHTLNAFYRDFMDLKPKHLNPGEHDAITGIEHVDKISS